MKRYSLFLISLILLMTTGCNQRKEVAENPFFEEWETPYGVPPFDRIRPEHFLPAFQRAMSIQEAEIDAIKSNGDQALFRECHPGLRPLGLDAGAGGGWFSTCSVRPT